MNYQAKVIKQYEKQGYYVINLISTNKNGIPDLLALKKGEEPFFIECKKQGDTIKPLQKFRIDELKEKGFKAICLHEVKGIIY